VDEPVFDHPLNESLAHERGRVVHAGGGLHPFDHGGGGARCDAVHHGVGAAGVGLHPSQQFGALQRGQELHQALARTIAVVAQVVAIEQGHRSSTGQAARVEQRAQSTVQGSPSLALAHRIDIGLQLGKGGPIELVLGVEVVTGLGHGEGHDARGWVAGQGHQRGQVGLVGHDVANRGDALVSVFTGWADGL
jgi:hypothetical protein